MANTLRFKRGLASGIPTALAGEPLFTTDTFDLYIGNGTTNTRFQKYIASGTTSQILRGDGSLYTFPLAISSPTTGQVLKYNGTSWVNDSDSGITGSGAAGQVAYFTGATTQGGSNNLFWDATNNRLGIGTNTPSAIFHARISASAELIFQNSSQNNLNISGTNATINLDSTGGSVFPGIFLKVAGTNYSQFTGNATETAIISFQTTPIVFKNSSTERARIFPSTGNFGINTGATDSGQRLQVIGTGYFSDSVGIGSTSITNIGLRISKTITGATTSYGQLIDGQIQSTVTSGVYSASVASTQAASFTLTNLFHYLASQGTFGAGSTVTNQFGFRVQSELIGATNNYGFYGDIAAATGRWNLYMNGTANNYLRGNTAINTTTINDNGLTINQSVNGSNVLLSLRNDAGNADNEVSIKMIAGSFTAGELGTILTHRRIGTGGAAFIIKTNATLGGTPVEAGRFTQSQNLHLGTFTADSGEKLQVTGTAKISGRTVVGGSLGVNGTTFTNPLAVQTGANTTIYFVETSATTTAFNAVNNTNTDVRTLAIQSVGGATTIGGTLSVASNLTVDTNTLFVDATNNRVGVGTIIPDVTFRVAGTINTTQAAFGNTDGRGLAIATTSVSGTNEAGTILNARGASSGTLIIQTDGTERMRVKEGGQVRFSPLASAPTINVEAGDVYYDSSTNKLRCYNGTSWNDLF